MNNLASSYSKLGRHEEALAMRERVLEFDRRVLPENHPIIGEGHVMSLVAFDVCSSDCLISSSDHLLAGDSLINLSSSCRRCGDIPRALQLAREALRILQTALPAGHDDINDALLRGRHLEQAMEGAGGGA